jgi:hypothetical protein
MKLACLGAQRPDLICGRFRFEQGVVDPAGQFHARRGGQRLRGRREGPFVFIRKRQDFLDCQVH